MGPLFYRIDTNLSDFGSRLKIENWVFVFRGRRAPQLRAIPSDGPDFPYWFSTMIITTKDVLHDFGLWAVFNIFVKHYPFSLSNGSFSYHFYLRSDFFLFRIFPRFLASSYFLTENRFSSTSHILRNLLIPPFSFFFLKIIFEESALIYSESKPSHHGRRQLRIAFHFWDRTNLKHISPAACRCLITLFLLFVSNPTIYAEL